MRSAISSSEQSSGKARMYGLISETTRLEDFPGLGRIVPEYKNDVIREVIFRPYHVEAW